MIAMPQITILYWRDIPAQVVVKEGRKSAKRQLPERFEQGIDMAAMRADKRDSDAYMAEWRRGEPLTVDGDDLEAIVDAEAKRLDALYDQDRLKLLIGNGGLNAAE
jgi:Virulence factor